MHLDLMARRLASLALLAAAAVSPACSDVPPPNVMMLMVDTLRAPSMSLYGYGRQTTPHLDEFAHRAVVFDRARSQASCTFPSVNSILTSRYSQLFLDQPKDHFGIPAPYVSIAEILRDHGYFTAAVSASPIVRATPSKHNPNGGFGRGFEVFDETPLWLDAGIVNQRVLHHLDSTVSAPFFMYVHYMDPHDPYRPPPTHPRQFAPPREGPDFLVNGDPNPVAEALYDGAQWPAVEPDQLGYLRDLYDEEISYFDARFGELVEELEARDLLDSTLVVLLADHGEEFLDEHGLVKHCRGVFETSTHTPLVIREPGREHGTRVASPVENVDVVPTILSVAGIDSEGYILDGIPLPMEPDEGRPPRYVYCFQGKWRSIDNGRLKIIYDAKDETYAMYDVQVDPLEQHDIFDPDDPDATTMVNELKRWLREQRGSATLADRKRQELKALGYLE